MRRYVILGLFLAAVMPGCVVLYLDEVSKIGQLKESMATEDMVVEYSFNKKRPTELVELKVYMLTNRAEEIGAPTSVQFQELLGEHIVQQERLIGHKICPKGYKLGKEPFNVKVDGGWDDILQVRYICKSA